MSTAATAAHPHPVRATLARAADTVTRHVVVALATLVAVQILATVALFFSINHNGWLTYQGGDQIWLVTSGWLLGQGTIGYALTSHGWPMLLAPLTWITGSSSVQLLPLTTILQVGVLGPIATLAVYDIGARLAGRLAGLWCAAAFVAAPFAAIPYFVQRYHDSWVDQFLPQAFGLTQQADFPSVVAVLVSVALTVRALEAGAHREAVLAGTFAGVALALKPANALFLGGPVLAFLLARRFGGIVLFAVALTPALLALTIWKSKGLGEVPLFAQGETRLAAGLGDPAVASVSSWFDRTVHLNFDTWKQNMSNLREFTWSARVVQFLPLAGAIAVARRSVPAAGLFLGWLLGYVVVKGAASVATIESGSYWRLDDARAPRVRASRRRRSRFSSRRSSHGWDARLAPLPGDVPASRATAIVVAFLALVPLAVLLGSSPARSTRNRDPAAGLRLLGGDRERHRGPGRRKRRIARRPGDRGRQRARVDGLDEPRTHLLSRLPRLAVEGVPGHGLRAARRDRCELRAETLTTTRDRRYRRSRPAAGRRLPDRRGGQLARRPTRRATSSRSAHRSAPLP